MTTCRTVLASSNHETHLNETSLTYMKYFSQCHHIKPPCLNNGRIYVMNGRVNSHESSWLTMLIYNRYYIVRVKVANSIQTLYCNDLKTKTG